MSGLGLDVAIAAGSAPVAGAGGSSINANLLLYTEEFDNAVWTKFSAVVTPNAGNSPLGSATADEIALIGSISQVSSVPASSGSAINTDVSPAAAWQRFLVTATFDVGVYTFSVWLRDLAENGLGVTLSLVVSGGFIAARLVDQGDEAVFQAWGAKLETGATATGDETNYGVNP